MPKIGVSKQNRFFEGIGRRKTAVARVRLTGAKEQVFFINGKSLEAYFQDPECQRICKEVFDRVAPESIFAVSVRVQGGGVTSQAEAIRHGIARALKEQNPDLKPLLRGLGYLKRDSRMRERKKFGLRRARRARQWRKR